VLQLEEHGLVIQIVGIVMTLAGLLILMRRGYLSLISKYNLGKLKSVLEHILLGHDFFIDVIGLLMGVLNVLMIVNAGKTLKYKYESEKKYKFLRHIFDTLRESIIFYI
jgi:hypothetical protein